MKSILFICRDSIGERMAGTAQRYVELACAAGKHTAVGLIAPPGSIRPKVLPNNIEFLSKNASISKAAQFMSQYEVWFSQGISKKELFLLRRNKAQFIFDGYDPVYIENLERLSYEQATASGEKHLEFIRSELRRALLNAQYIAYAIPSQKYYLLGQLQALKGLKLEDYSKDHSGARKFICLPFGMHAQPKLDASKREKLRNDLGVGQNDQLTLWGGGIWNWFDPMTLLDAIRKGHAPKHTKVYFPGFRHPDPNVPQMMIANNVLSYLKKYPAVRKQVIIGESWTPYERRSELFGIADVGLSLHYQSLETELAFRTRALEYLAHEVPILSTEGDYFAAEIKDCELGTVVPYIDPQAIGLALRSMMNTDLLKNYKQSIVQYRKKLDWDVITENLLEVL